MKNSILVFLLFVMASKAQNTYSYAPINDTIAAANWEEAMELTFGLLDKSHFPSGYLFDKTSPIEKLNYANGELNDSTFNMLEFYFLQNVVKMSYNRPDSIINYLKLDSLKNVFISENNILPFGFINIIGQSIKPSAFTNSHIIVNNNRLSENTTNFSLIYQDQRFFCIAPLNMEVQTLNPQFIIRPDELFSNATSDITSLEIDLDDGLGYQPISIGVPFQANYATDGFKIFTTRVTYGNGDTLYSRSELLVNNSNILSRLSSTFKPYDHTYDIFEKPGVLQLFLGYFPNEFSSGTYQTETIAQVGVWLGCNNKVNNGRAALRRPYIIFGGYNPKDGKSLEEPPNIAPWLNQAFGSLGWADGWRGPLYETYNGFFTSYSKNAGGGQAFGDNGAKLIDKLTQEGYDVCIVRFKNGIGFLQTNAYLASLVIKDINNKILTESYNITDPGAALDPEDPNYPNSTKIKRSKHELVVGGYSAGALSGRLALTLMEYEHAVRDQCIPTSARKSPHHRTKIWVGVDHECQGSNTPIGLQMFWDFQKSVGILPSGLADILNSLVSKGALDLLQERGVATQNTLYHIDNTFDQGGTWATRPHQDFLNYFHDLGVVTLPTTPANLRGYPVFPYRISISQGNANGLPQTISNETNILHNQSPSSWCVKPFNFTTPFREATARVLSSWNSDAFDCRVGISFRTIFYSWHVNFGHWKYYTNNLVNDWWLGGPAKNYDEATASTLPANILFANGLSLSGDYPTVAFTSCNLKQFPKKHVGFAPTVSGLDLHLPGNNNLPRFPNMSIVPGNVSGGLNLMKQNNYPNITNNSSPHNDFGYPHLTFPNNHYDYTPYDAIWAHGDNINTTNYDDNTMHVEDPTPFIGEFLAEELAPTTLYLSNRTIKGEQYTCNGNTLKQKYYADFEARNSVLAGDQSIYQRLVDPNNSNSILRYDRKRTAPGDFVVGEDAVVTIRANNGNGTSSLTLGPGFSSKHGSIFRAYVFTDPNMCSPFGSQRMATQNNAAPTLVAKESRPIITTKRAVTQNKTLLNKQNTAKVINLYPNPTNASVNVEINDSRQTYTYVLKDVAGKELQKGNLNDINGKIDLSTFSRGVYFITIETESIIQTNRIILQW